jgi:hypothetical protein
VLFAALIPASPSNPDKCAFDPCSAWTAKANKRVQFGYGLNYLIDVEHAVIVDVEATPARTYDEVEATKKMIERTEACFDLSPKRLIADTKKRGAYICPAGKLLKTTGTVHDGRTLLYRASKRDCDACPLRAKCCTTADARKIPVTCMKTLAMSRGER